MQHDKKSVKAAHKADKKGAKAHSKALLGLQAASKAGDLGPQPRPPVPINPIKGLQDALKAAQVEALARQVAETTGGVA